MSLRARMGLVAGLAVAVAVIAAAAVAYAGTSSELSGQLDRSLLALRQQILNRAGPPGGGPGKTNLQGTPPQAQTPAEGEGASASDCDEHLGFDQSRGGPFGTAAGVVTLVHPDGMRCSPPGQGYDLPATNQFRQLARRGHGTVFTDMTVRGTELRVLASGAGWRGALLVALPLASVDDALDRQLILLVIIAAGGIGLAALLGVLVARTALAPIARFTRQTEAIAANPERIETERLDVQGSDELARLAQTFNRTLDALEASVEAQRNLVADASHELRTPIATIRANLQLMRDEELLPPEDRRALREDVMEELDELTALVGDVVELARGTKPDGEPGEVRVDEIVRAAVDRAGRRFPELTVTLTTEPTLVYGQGDRIARAVGNLLDNAAKYGGSAGTVEVVLRNGVLTVRDHGPGFHEEDLPFVFDRFHRAADARSQPGSGLGLAIVRQAAEAHGGSAEADNALGGGAVIRVSFGPTLALDPASAPGAVSGA